MTLTELLKLLENISSKIESENKQPIIEYELNFGVIKIPVLISKN